MSPKSSSKMKGFKTMNGGSILNFHNSEMSDNASSGRKHHDKQIEEGLNTKKVNNITPLQEIDAIKAV